MNFGKGYFWKIVGVVALVALSCAVLAAGIAIGLILSQPW